MTHARDNVDNGIYGLGRLFFVKAGSTNGIYGIYDNANYDLRSEEIIPGLLYQREKNHGYV